MKLRVPSAQIYALAGKNVTSRNRAQSSKEEELGRERSHD